jgi:hypothetical protein
MLQKEQDLQATKLTDEYAQKIDKSITDMADAVASQSRISQLPGMQPLLKLHPPTKGFKGN